MPRWCIHSSFEKCQTDSSTSSHLTSCSLLYTAFCLNTFSSVQSRLTLCDPMNRSTPGLPVHHQLPEFTQTHVHRVSDAIQPSHPLSSPFPPAPNPSQHQSLFQWVNTSHEAAKVLEFHHSFQRILEPTLASFLPKNSQGWSPSEWTGWISLQSKRFSSVFSKPQFKVVYSFSYLEAVCCSMASSNLLPDLHTGFSIGRSGGLVFPSLEEFSTVYCDSYCQSLWHSQ